MPLFGLSLQPTVDDLDAVLRAARLADEVGLDLATLSDHPYDGRYYDSSTVLATLAATTTRIRLGIPVANLPVRHPAGLAKAAATIDVLSGGRIELGLGGGAPFSEAGVKAFGAVWRSPAERVGMVEEAIQVMRLLWSSPDAPPSDRPPVSFEGTWYRLDGATPGPGPAHRIPIFVGAMGRRMLEITGRLADGWSISLSRFTTDEIAKMSAQIDAAATSAGRDPGDIRRHLNLYGTIRAGDSIDLPSREGPPGLDGSVDHWVTTLTGYATDLGIDSFGVSTVDEQQIRLLATEVVPGVRASLARHAGEATEVRS